jgi:hypothetical protein
VPAHEWEGHKGILEELGSVGCSLNGSRYSPVLGKEESLLQNNLQCVFWRMGVSYLDKETDIWDRRSSMCKLSKIEYGQFQGLQRVINKTER